VGLDDLQHTRTEAFPRLRGGGRAAELRDAEGISHVILHGVRKGEEITL
jgi:hypothetical protein